LIVKLYTVHFFFVIVQQDIQKHHNDNNNNNKTKRKNTVDISKYVLGFLHFSVLFTYYFESSNVRLVFWHIPYIRSRVDVNGRAATRCTKVYLKKKTSSIGDREKVPAQADTLQRLNTCILATHSSMVRRKSSWPSWYGESLDTSHPICVYTPIVVPATTLDLHLWTKSLQNTNVIKNT
jgi:hypothetical protein